MTDRSRARALAQESIARQDATGWFERLYAEAATGDAIVPWADRTPNPHVVAWLDRQAIHRGRALDIGAGLGDTAADLARRGWDVLAFDVAATAVAEARARFPQPSIDFRVADLLALDAGYDGAFDLVIECYTLQVLPPAARPHAIAALRRLVAPGGTLLVVARGREAHDPAGEMPWPLTRAEVDAIAAGPLRLAAFEDFLDDEDPPVRRFRAEFRRDR